MTQDLRFRTHEVCNQPAPLAHYNAWTSDTALAEAVAREGGGWADHELTDYGGLVGGEMRALGVQIPPQRDRSFRNSVTAVSASVTADSDLIVTDFDGSSE